MNFYNFNMAIFVAVSTNFLYRTYITKYTIFVSEKRIRVRDGDVHVDDGCWTRNVLVTI